MVWQNLQWSKPKQFEGCYWPCFNKQCENHGSLGERKTDKKLILFSITFLLGSMQGVHPAEYHNYHPQLPLPPQKNYNWDQPVTMESQCSVSKVCISVFPMFAFKDKWCKLVIFVNIYFGMSSYSIIHWYVIMIYYIPFIRYLIYFLAIYTILYIYFYIFTKSL
jgi:hypothetical protein